MAEREPKTHFNVGGPRGWTTACGIESSSFVTKEDEWDEVDCQRCLKKRPIERSGHPFTYNPRSAGKIVTDFEKWARRDEMRGSEHPDLRDWIHECYLIARERMVRRLTGDSRPTRYMPRRPEVDYDR